MAAKANIVIDQGATFDTILNLTDDAGDPLPLNNYTAVAQIRKWYTSLTAVEFEVTIPTPETGEVYLHLDASVTADMAPGRFVYDVVIIGHGVVTRVVEGILTVTPEVTQVTY